MSFHEEVWKTFTAVDVNPLIEKNNKVDYVTWSKIWRVIMDIYPASFYSFEDRRIPGMGENGPMETVEVSCTLTILGDGDGDLVQRTMHLPVMQSMVPFNAIENPTARHISDAKMRCLVKTAAMCGLGLTMWSGSEFEAVDNQVEEILKFAKIKSAVRMELWRTAIVIKTCFVDEDVQTALEAWRECSEEEMKLLWQAETKGGFFTMAEKDWLRAIQFAEAQK